MDAEARAGIIASLPEEVSLLLRIEELDEIERQNPLASNPRKERVGEHSWFIAVCVPLLAAFSSEPIDIPKATLLAVVHDVVEAFVGDTFAFGPDVVDQHSREHAAMQKLTSEYSSPSVARLVELWDEYEAQETPEARFVKGIDAFVPILFNFTNVEHSSWVEHGVRAEQVQKRLDRVRNALGNLAAINDQMIRQAQSDGNLL
jgi:putative hydrolases of HD superfamily